MTLEILDQRGALVRRFSSDDAPEPVDSSANIPLWWVRPSQRLGAEAGAHRFVWDLRYPPPPDSSHSYPIAAIYRDTPREPRGAWALPGAYTVRLTVGGRSLTQPLTIRMDPRVTTPAAGLAAQFALATRVADAMRRDSAALHDVRALRARLTPQRERAGVAAVVDSLTALDRELARVVGQLVRLFGIVEGADAAPTTQALRGAETVERALAALLVRVDAVKQAAAAVAP